MVSSRDKLKERGLVQIAVWLSQDSAALLKRLASERGQSATKIVEQAIAALAGLPTEPATSAPGVQALVSELAAALERTNARLSALEAPSAALAPATGAEGVSEIEPAKIALPTPSAGIPSPGGVRVFAKLADGEKAALVKVVRDWQQQGKTLRDIGAGLLREHGVGTATGKALWPPQVQRIIDG